LAISALALLAATWRLWLPQTDFPQVPLFDFARSAPAWLDWLGLTVLVGALLVAGVVPQRSRLWQPALLILASTLLAMVVLDQHRLQAWAYQFAIVSVGLATLPKKWAVPWLRLFVVSIYFHSALSKLDYGFLHEHGPLLLSGMVKPFGLSPDDWPERITAGLSLLMPVGELLVAVGLCVQRFRRAAVFAAVCMHLMLMLAVGPFGLDHEWGVLLWNAYFIGQAVLLWGGSEQPAETPIDPVIENPRTFRTVAPCVLIAFVSVWPFASTWGWCDTWPAWELYASRPECAKLYVTATARERLPPSIQKHVGQPDWHDWCRVRIDRWSLEAIGAPEYPQNRVRVGIALALADSFQLDEEIRIVLESPAARWTGTRSERTLTGRRALFDQAATYRFNAKANELKPRISRMDTDLK
jgi:hypothetical protein